LIRHRTSYKAKKDEPVSQHFNGPNHTIKDLRITWIKQIRNLWDSTRMKWEIFWINTLETTTAPGLNIREWTW
jgi:hypothetical protein